MSDIYLVLLIVGYSIASPAYSTAEHSTEQSRPQQSTAERPCLACKEGSVQGRFTSRKGMSGFHERKKKS
jgi:hypothetical protein